MATIDIFGNSAFSMTSLTGAINNRPALPSMITGMNLFTPKSVRSKDLFVDQTDGVLKLIGFSERGAPATQGERGGRKSINFTIPRLATEDKVWAQEIAGLRETGSETELMSVQTEVMSRLDQMNQNISYSEEYLALAALQGKVLDPADGSTFENFFTAFGVTPASTVNFALTTDATLVKQKCEELVIDIQRSAKGAWVYGQSRVEALVGDDFWFALTQHPNVEKYYEKWSAMAELKNLDASQEFTFGGITFRRYIGSDDNSEVAIATGEAKFYVVGGRDIFVKAMAPADEHMEFVNTLGKDRYVITKDDVEYSSSPRWKGFDVRAYPLYMCQRPQTLRSGVVS